MIDLHNIQAPDVTYFITIAFAIYNAVVLIGKFFCVEPFWSYSSSKYYESGIAFTLNAFTCSAFAVSTFGLLVDARDVYMYSFVMTCAAGTVLTLGSTIWGISKTVMFCLQYHHKLVEKRTGEKNAQH